MLLLNFTGDKESPQAVLCNLDLPISQQTNSTLTNTEVGFDSLDSLDQQRQKSLEYRK